MRIICRPGCLTVLAVMEWRVVRSRAGLLSKNRKRRIRCVVEGRFIMRLDTGTMKTHDASCSCPVCAGLECLERSRYFSGQLLTEAELNSEQAYILAKNRLHNRYLHGSGIVCGLQVSCSACAGAVTIESGYAIDPCGNDIIVCNTQDFNVIQRIR